MIALLCGCGALLLAAVAAILAAAACALGYWGILAVMVALCLVNLAVAWAWLAVWRARCSQSR